MAGKAHYGVFAAPGPTGGGARVATPVVIGSELSSGGSPCSQNARPRVFGASTATNTPLQFFSMAVFFMRSNRMGPYPDPRNSGDRISNPGSCCRDWGIQNFVHTPLDHTPIIE